MKKFITKMVQSGNERANVIILSVAAFFLVFVSINYYISVKSVISGTGHFFLPSTVYVSKTIPAFSASNFTPGTFRKDSIETGDFILSVNHVSADTMPFMNYVNSEIDKNGYGELLVFRTGKLAKAYLSKSEKVHKTLYKTVFVDNASLNKNSLRFLSHGAIIAYLEPGGATERAGLKIGDVIFSINGQPMKFSKTDMYEARAALYRLIRNQEAGERSHYVFLRNNEILSTDVYMAVLGMRLEGLVSLICGLLLYSLGLFYILKKPKLFSAKIVGLSLLSIGLTLLTAYFANPPGMNLFSTLIFYLDKVSFMFIFPILYHSMIYFPDYKFGLYKRRWLLITNYAFAAVIILFFSIWYFIDYRGVNLNLFFWLEVVQFALFLSFLIFNRLGEKTVEERRGYYLFYTILLLVLFGLFFKSAFWVIFERELPPIFNYDLGITILLPAAYIATTLKYKIFGLKLKIKRSIQYLAYSVILKSVLSITGLMIIYFLIGLSVKFPIIHLSSTKIEVIPGSLEPGKNIIFEKLFFLLSVILLISCSYYLWKYLQNRIDLKFYREKKNYKLLQTELIDVLNKKFTIDGLAKILLEKLVELIHLKFAGIVFVKEEKTIWEDKIYLFDGQRFSSAGIEMPEDAMNELKKYSEDVQVDYLLDAKKEDFQIGTIEKVIVIKFKEKLLGLLFIGEKLSETPVDKDDLDFLYSLTSNIAVAIDNTFLYEQLSQQERMKHELEIARSLQLATLPTEIPGVNGLEIFAKSIPALEVGGDFYDFLNGTPNELTVIIGDVSGKGTSSALYMSKMQGILQTLYEFKLSPRELMVKANKLLYKHILPNSFVTVLGGKFDTKNELLHLVRAGHLPLYYYDARLDKVRQSCPRGIGLGLSSDEVFESSIEELTFKIKHDDVFLFISDGVVESMNSKGEEYGSENLNDVLRRCHGKSPNEIGEAIISSVRNFSENALQFDDITLVIVKIK